MVQLESSSATAETPAHEGYKLANTITLHHVTSKVQADSAVDLSNILQQQAATYPGLRARLGEAAARKVATKTVQPVTDNDRDLMAAQEGLLQKSSTEIICPLHSRLLAQIEPNKVSLNSVSGQLSADMVEGLNQRIKNGQILWNLHNSFVLDIGSSVAVKICTHLDPDHITNLQFVNTHAPEVPTPECLGALRSGQKTYFFMSRPDGVTLESVWAQLSAAQKTSVHQQLNTIFLTLRSQPPPSTHADLPIGSFTSTTCKDMRRSQRVSPQPVYSERAFNDFVCFEPGRTKTTWIKMIRSSMREDHAIVFTHGDLHPRNIMVMLDEVQNGSKTESQIQITSLIDWELSGWYPEYWEFVKALNTIGHRGPLADWLDYLPITIGQWPVEYAVDSLIDRWLG